MHFGCFLGDEIKTIGPLTKMSLTSLLTKEVVDESETIRLFWC